MNVVNAAHPRGISERPISALDVHHLVVTQAEQFFREVLDGRHADEVTAEQEAEIERLLDRLSQDEADKFLHLLAAETERVRLAIVTDPELQSIFEPTAREAQRSADKPKVCFRWFSMPRWARRDNA